MKNKLINAIVNLNLDHDDYLLIKNDIFESNNQSLRIISLLGVIIFTFMIIFSFFSPIFEVYSYIYFIADIIFLFLLILSFLNFFNTNKRKDDYTVTAKTAEPCGVWNIKKLIKK